MRVEWELSPRGRRIPVTYLEPDEIFHAPTSSGFPDSDSCSCCETSRAGCPDHNPEVFARWAAARAVPKKGEK